MDTFVFVLVRILEVLFIVGVIGSAVVWVLTTVEDVVTLFKRNEPSGGGAETQPS